MIDLMGKKIWNCELKFEVSSKLKIGKKIRKMLKMYKTLPNKLMPSRKNMSVAQWRHEVIQNNWTWKILLKYSQNLPKETFEKWLIKLNKMHKFFCIIIPLQPLNSDG